MTYAILGAIVAAAIALAIWLRRSSPVPPPADKTTELAITLAGDKQKADAQTAAEKVKHATDADVDARVDALRARGRSGK